MIRNGSEKETDTYTSFSCWKLMIVGTPYGPCPCPCPCPWLQILYMGLPPRS